jgi:hypothetical protein
VDEPLVASLSIVPPIGDLDQGPVTQYENGSHTAVDELLEFLKNWFVEHIVDEDTGAQSRLGRDLWHSEGLVPAVQAFLALDK